MVTTEPEQSVADPEIVPAVGDAFTDVVATFDTLFVLHPVSTRLKSVACVMAGAVTPPVELVVVNVDQVFWPEGLDCQLKLVPEPPEADNAIVVPGQTEEATLIVPGVYAVTFMVTVSINRVCVGPG